MNFISFLLLISIVLTPGLASWLTFGNGSRLQLSGLESVFIWLLSGTAVVSWLSLTLAEFGLFYLPLLLTLILLPSGFMIGWTIWRGRFKLAFADLTWNWLDGAVVGLLLVSIFLSGRPSEYIVGGRDHGVYVNTGIHIAKTGGIIVADGEITAVPTELRTILVLPETRLYQAGFPGPWSEGQRMTGLTIRDLDSGVYLPHAFHLYPALIAVFFAIGGVPTALLTTMFLALMGSLAIYLTTARLFGQPIGLLTLLLLTFSVTQVWFTGYPTAEIMVQLFFWGGLFALSLLVESGDRTTAILAGACFGLLHLTKLDTVLVPVTLGVLFLYLWLRQQFQPAYWWGIGVYFLLSLQALWHASVITTTYFIDHAVRVLLPDFLANTLITATEGHPYPADWLPRLFTANWSYLLLGAIGVIVALLLLGWLQPRLRRWLAWLFQQPQHWQVGLSLGLGVMMIGTAVLSQNVELPMLTKTEQAVQLTRLYLTRIGLVAGALGWLLLIYRTETTSARLSLFILAGNIAPLYLLGAGTALDHFWVVRRFVPLAFPVMILGMAHLIWFLRPYRVDRWFTAAVPIGILLLLLAGFGQHLRFIAGVVEYNGLTEQLEKFAGSFPEGSILLMETSNEARRMDLPLWFIFDKTIFTIQSEVREDLRLKTAVTNWVQNGRKVYWLAANSVTPPNWSEGNHQLAFTQTIDVPLMETPRDHIPFQLERFQVSLNVYQIIQP